MKKIIKLSAVLALGASFAFGAVTSDADVKAHVLKGAEYCKTAGLEVCLKEFNDKSNTKWVIPEKDLYIWANDFDGVITAHPMKPIKGKNLYKYKDKAGNQLFADFIKKVKAEGQGWVDYEWSHPKTGKQTPKTSFVIGIGDNQLIGAGKYKE